MTARAGNAWATCGATNPCCKVLRAHEGRCSGDGGLVVRSSWFSRGFPRIRCRPLRAAERPCKTTPPAFAEGVSNQWTILDLNQ